MGNRHGIFGMATASTLTIIAATSGVNGEGEATETSTAAAWSASA